MTMLDREEQDYVSGDDLLAQFNLTSPEQRLEHAVKALMEQLEQLHYEHESQSLSDNIDNPDIFCSCADAYRMGDAALKD